MNSIKPAISSESTARDYVARFADSAALARLDLFVGLLLAENQKQNLISKPSEANIWQRHVADSAQLLKYVSRETLIAQSDPWLDLGTGAGFPGLVIAALLPEQPVALVESRGKRAEFLRNCCEQMDLRQCTVYGDRLERIMPFECSVISARAFAPLAKLLSLSSPFSTKHTVYLLPKGRSAAQELGNQPKAIRSMFHVEQSLTDPDAGIIVRA